MAEEVPVCENLLALASRKAGSEALTKCLELLGQRCGAVEVAILLYDHTDDLLYSDVWTEASVVNNAGVFSWPRNATLILDQCRQSGMEIFELGPALGPRGILAINVMGRPLPDEITTNFEFIKSIFYLVLDRARLQEDGAKSAQRLADLGELGNDWLWEMDAEGRFTYISKELALLGLEAGTFVPPVKPQAISQFFSSGAFAGRKQALASQQRQTMLRSRRSIRRLQGCQFRVDRACRGGA
jgi:hypothetical protein